MEYLPVAGNKEFITNALELAYGNDNSYLKEGCFAGVQGVGGTGAIRIGAEFLNRWYKGLEGKGGFEVMMPKPTWANHPKIFGFAGCEVGQYSYYDYKTKSLDFDGMRKDLEDSKEGNVVLLHGCAHNPTGVDPNEEQWSEISEIVKKKKLIPFFDLAYQGFTSGDLKKDAFAVRKFVRDGHKILLAQSFAKNFGLYSHRVACMSVLTNTKEEADAIQSQLKILVRPMYSNPPVHGVRIVNEILKDETLKGQWEKELRGMANRIIEMRKRLREDLEKIGSKLSWNHITDQHGMFCYSGLTEEQVEKLKKEHSVYLTSNGRISMAGVTSKNVYYLANAIHEVTQS